MTRNITLIVYPVNDIEKAKAYYSQFLAAQPYTDSPYYVGYRVGNLEIGLDPNAEVGPISYTDVDDIKASLQEMTAIGADVVQDVNEITPGLLIAQVKDKNGNVVGLRQQSEAQ